MFAALALAILTRSVIHHPPTYDELLHILAARGVAASGRPAIADGIYDRAELYTRAVAFAGRFASDELVGAREPAWLAALLLTALVSAWTVRKAGLLAGFVAGGLLAVNPWTIDLAVFARFYTLQALAIFTAFACLYEAAGIATRRGAAAAYVAVAAVALAFALHFQITTIIAVGALGAGIAAGVAVERADSLSRAIRRNRVPVMIACIGALAGAILVLFRFDMLQTFRETSPWSAAAANRLTYYNNALAKDMPLFWPLVPFAALGACVVRPRMGWTLVVAAATAFSIHSLAAAKATRYAYYALPFLCILLGCGLSVGFSFLNESLASRWPRIGRAAPVLVLAAFGLSFAASQEGYRAARLLLAADPYSKVLSYGDETTWSGARPMLAPLAARADAIVTSNAMKALYYLGRYDYELNASIVPETDTHAEFGTDERTGRQAISTASSLAKVLAAHARTLIVAENEKLGIGYGVPSNTVAIAETACDRAEVPAAARITVWSCTRGSRDER